jgi:hypothetical protein
MSMIAKKMNKIILSNCLLTLLLIFLFLEFLYPIFFKTPKLIYKFYDDRTVTFFPNKVLYSHEDEFRIKFKTNEFGFNDYKFDNPTDILILGDSFVESIQVDRKKHFAEYIKKEFKVKIAKIGMSGYGNSHYFSNYSKFVELLDPKLVIIINRSNDLRNNFCNSNTQNCSKIDKLCEINSEDNLRKNIKFLKIDGENYRFIYTKKKKKNDIKVKILRNFIDRFQSYYSLRHIYTMYLKRNKIIENDLVTKKVKKNKSDCQKSVDNYYVKKYYNEINNLIYQKIVITDKRKLLFVNVVPHKNLAGAEALFLTKTFNESSLPYVNFIQNDKLRFKKDSHWNEFGHKEFSDAMINEIKKNYNIFK